MSFKKLLLKGILGLVLMGSIQAAPYQTLAQTEGNGTIMLVDWCGNHWCPHHRHHHHPYYVVPEYRYHETYEQHVRHCRQHPHSLNCERFCALNGPLCYPHRGW